VSGGVSKAASTHSSGGMQDIIALRAKGRQNDKKEKKKRRESARVVGERVYFPGSPAPVTTTQLLEEAEKEVASVVSPAKGGESVSVSSFRVESVSTPMSQKFDTPALEKFDAHADIDTAAREWTKAEWKALDACFTDERIAIAARRFTKRAGAVMMVPADAIDLGAVIARFVAAHGADWDPCVFLALLPPFYIADARFSVGRT
jgi:hypothetical protein